MRDAEHFAVLVDESKDACKKEQISVIVWYLQCGVSGLCASCQRCSRVFWGFFLGQWCMIFSWKNRELKKLCDTWWACQYNAIWPVKKTLPAIRAILRDIGQSNLHWRTEARAISVIIDEVCFASYSFRGCIQKTKFMSDQLQSPNFDLVAADDLAQSVITAISEKGTDDKWKRGGRPKQLDIWRVLLWRPR